MKPQPAKKRTSGRAPHASRHSERWEAQRRTLIAAAQNTIRQRGPGVSMDDIAAGARVAKPILYRHFGDRAGLARALGESVILLSSSGDKAEMLQRMSAMYPAVDNPADLRRVLQGFIGQFSSFVEMDTDLYHFLQTEQALQRMMQGEDGKRLRNPVAESLTRSLLTILEARGMDRAPADVWAHALVALAGGAIERWAENKAFHRFDLESYVLDLAWHGIKGLLEDKATKTTKATTRAKARGRRVQPAKRHKPRLKRAPPR
jgi:AcrR family transcriptional regulator